MGRRRREARARHLLQLRPQRVGAPRLGAGASDADAGEVAEAACGLCADAKGGERTGRGEGRVLSPQTIPIETIFSPTIFVLLFFLQRPILEGPGSHSPKKGGMDWDASRVFSLQWIHCSALIFQHPEKGRPLADSSLFEPSDYPKKREFTHFRILGQ